MYFCYYKICAKLIVDQVTKSVQGVLIMQVDYRYSLQ